jgi:hypothetical protein
MSQMPGDFRKMVLLTRESPFQVYAANQLYQAGVISHVVFEHGDSFVRSDAITPHFSSVATGIRQLFGQPRLALHRAYRLLNRDLWYGKRDFHNQRILGEVSPQLVSGLQVLRIGNINDVSLEDIGDIRLALVFGTRLIKAHVIERFGCPVINLHWGWSPDYRGEGIVSALANGGVDALGATVHVLTPSIDGGPILSRRRPSLDVNDNLYSIGLRLAVLGTGMLVEEGRKILEGCVPEGIPQDRTIGRLYSKSFMDAHPELYVRAWKCLRQFQRDRRRLHDVSP